MKKLAIAGVGTHSLMEPSRLPPGEERVTHPREGIQMKGQKEWKALADPAVVAAAFNLFCATAPGGPYPVGENNPYENGTPLDDPILKPGY